MKPGIALLLLFISLPVICLLSCSPQQPVSHSPIRASAYTYIASITNGQVYLTLNERPEQVIGPFVRKSDGSYTCETQDEGVHSLTRSPDGAWFYSWSHIHMRAESVDARILEK
jgi:hypothetical protein